MLCTCPHGTWKLVGGLGRTGCRLWIQTAWLLPTELHPSARNSFKWKIQKPWDVGLVFELFTEKCGVFFVCLFVCVWYAHTCVCVVCTHVCVSACTLTCASGGQGRTLDVFLSCFPSYF